MANKVILNIGIKYIVWALPLFFIGPTVINSAFKNEEHVMYIPILGLGIIICIGAVYLLFKGLRTIMKSLFDDKT